MKLNKIFTKSLLLSTIILSSSLIYSMDFEEELNSKKNEKPSENNKESIVDIEKLKTLPEELKIIIISKAFEDLNLEPKSIGELENLLKLRTISKKTKNYIDLHYLEQIKKIKKLIKFKIDRKNRQPLLW